MAAASSAAHDTPARKSKDAGIRIVDVRHKQFAVLARQETRLNTAEHG